MRLPTVALTILKWIWNNFELHSKLFISPQSPNHKPLSSYNGIYNLIFNYLRNIIIIFLSEALIYHIMAGNFDACEYLSMQKEFVTSIFLSSYHLT